MLPSSMRYLTGTARSQTLLLPPAIDDYVGPDNAVRFIDALVDGLDLVDLGFARAMCRYWYSPVSLGPDRMIFHLRHLHQSFYG